LLLRFEIIKKKNANYCYFKYGSTDSSVKLNCEIFENLAIAGKIRCGRVKAESFVEKLLEPRSIEMILEQIRVSDDSPFFILFLPMLQSKKYKK
jgi:hypothetical protein